MLKGRLCNHEQTIWLLVVLRLVTLMTFIPFLRTLSDPIALKEHEGLTTVKGGCFLEQYNGGARLAQIFVQSSSRVRFLPNCLFRPKESMMTLLIISTVGHARFHEDAQAAIEAAKISHTVLSKDSIDFFQPTFKEAFKSIFTEHNIKSEFRATGLVPYEPMNALAHLDLKLRTLTPLAVKGIA